MPSIFTKIINNELPAYRIFENDKVISFLTIEPIHPGHTLVIPKTEVDHWMDVLKDEYQEAYFQAQKIGKAIQKVTSSTRVAQAVVGLEVPHFHLHLILMWTPSDLDFKKAKRANDEELMIIQQRLTIELNK